jgi:hypothetical protein
MCFRMGAAYSEYVVRIRRELHLIPELMWTEHKTSAVVKRELTNMGITFEVGLALFTNTIQLMTSGMVHATNLTPPGSDNPSRAYGQRHHFDDSRHGPCYQSDPPRE